MRELAVSLPGRRWGAVPSRVMRNGAGAMKLSDIVLYSLFPSYQCARATALVELVGLPSESTLALLEKPA